VTILLSVESLDCYYGESRVVDSASLEVADGAIACLIGRNGVGKTTTVKAIMGLVKSPKGEIVFEGHPLGGLAPYERARLGIGYVPQGRDIFPQLTVEENLKIGLIAQAKKGYSLEYIYSLFPMLESFARRMGGDLSGGQQQQLAIARALATDPKLLILDEPTEGIQPSIIEDIERAIRTINSEKGVSFLIVEQYLDFVLRISDYIYVMEKGKIALEGKSGEVNTDSVRKIITGGAA